MTLGANLISGSWRIFCQCLWKRDFANFFGMS
jgi:hypothetical protein